ncbi:hypothetical protein [Castellaniella sp. S9]|uniref:hypothetical protein n=1 Tax=Castellaniella sp. S9 TaxID=2993652 RepID=UPI0022B4ACDD|nr:hypothetical protein [Castellaniella sp. S9]
MFQEFPKMLYRDDKNTIANDAEHENALRTDGWHDFDAEPKAEEKPSDQPRRGRPSRAEPKAEE